MKKKGEKFNITIVSKDNEHWINTLTGIGEESIMYKNGMLIRTTIITPTGNSEFKSDYDVRIVRKGEHPQLKYYKQRLEKLEENKIYWEEKSDKLRDKIQNEIYLEKDKYDLLSWDEKEKYLKLKNDVREDFITALNKEYEYRSAISTCEDFINVLRNY